jgi:hypothetical protein
VTVYALLTEKQTFFDANSNELTGGLLFVYLAGTTTKATSYVETDGVTPNSNPIVLNSRGEVPSGLYVAGGALYKLVLAPATDTDPPTSPIWTRDNLTPTNDVTVSSAFSQWVTSTYTVSYSNATTFTVNGDVTGIYQVNRRVRATIGSGNLYGTIESSGFSLGVTTATVLWDSGSMDASLTAVDYALLSGADPSVPVPVTQRVRTSVVIGGATNFTTIAATIDSRTSSTTNLPTMSYTNTTADAGFIAMNFAKTRAGLTTSSGDIFARLTGSGVDTGNVARLAGYWDFRQTGAAGATFVAGQWLLSLTNVSGVDTTVIDATAARVNSAVPLQDSGARVFSRASGSMAESGELGIANNTTYSLAHGFAAVPKLVQAVLRCKTAEFGYAIGDEALLVPFVNSGSNVTTSVWADATNVSARINSSAANNYSIARISSNDAIAITYANWKIVLRAWY